MITTKKPKYGKWKEFSRRAVLVAEGFYLNNQKHGLWRIFDEDTGSLVIEEQYRHGLQHGRFVSYYQNGSVFSEGYFRNGNREGSFRIFDENGCHVRTLVFCNNDLVDDFEER